jgi:L-ascorbate metabolism protein UlaG (beta-lactamase superfamily)
MCFIDLVESSGTSGVSRRRFLEAGIGTGLAVSGRSWGRSGVGPGLAEGAESPPRSGGPGSSGVNFRWLGTNGWEISFGNKTILLDPWISRTDAGYFRDQPNPDTPLTLETALIDQHIAKADQILIGHGHYDHIADVPYIARKTAAMVLGSESHINMLRAYGLPEAKLVPCKGGEFIQFDGYTIEVIPSLHALGPAKKVLFPGRFASVPTIPRTIKDMPEGDTFVYLLTINRKFQIFLMSAGNFVERTITGLRPDVALVTFPSARARSLWLSELSSCPIPEAGPARDVARSIAPTIAPVSFMFASLSGNGPSCISTSGGDHRAPEPQCSSPGWFRATEDFLTGM